MFDNSAQGSVAEPSLLYLVTAATYFRQASRTRHPICAQHAARLRPRMCEQRPSCGAAARVFGQRPTSS